MSSLAQIAIFLAAGVIAPHIPLLFESDVAQAAGPAG